MSSLSPLTRLWKAVQPVLVRLNPLGRRSSLGVEYVAPTVERLESRQLLSGLPLQDPAAPWQGSGTVVTDFHSGEKDQANALLIQPDGRIVAVGASHSGQS